MKLIQSLTKLAEQHEDAIYTDEQEWIDAVRKAYPNLADNFLFRGRVEHGVNTISAEIKGEDKCYGVWDPETEQGKVFLD